MNTHQSMEAYSQTGLSRHMTKTFAWMALGLFITFVVASITFATGFLEQILSASPFMFVVIVVAQLGVVIALGARINKASVTTTRVLFIAYSILTGITLSSLSYSFNLESITVALLATVIYFVSLVIIGYTTKIDLSKVGSICMVGLFALIIYNVIGGLIFGLSTDSLLYSAVGLLIFTGLTAWDAQKAKKLYIANEGNEAMVAKLSIYSALELYLDFVNIFIYILRLVGNKN